MSKGVVDMKKELVDAFYEIDRLNNRLKYEYDVGYQRGYCEGLSEGQRKLIEYMKLEVRPIYVIKKERE